MKDYTDIQENAKQYYEKGGLCCSEVLLKVLLNYFSIPHEEDDTLIVAGFGGGIGSSGCSCGTLTGAVVAYGMILKGEKLPKKLLETLSENEQKQWGNAYSSRYLAHRLHEYFKEVHHMPCCRTLTRKVKDDKKAQKAFCLELIVELSKISALYLDEYMQFK